MAAAPPAAPAVAAAAAYSTSGRAPAASHVYEGSSPTAVVERAARVATAATGRQRGLSRNRAAASERERESRLETPTCGPSRDSPCRWADEQQPQQSVVGLSGVGAFFVYSSTIYDRRRGTTNERTNETRCGRTHG
eukprot:GHVU01047692.1.p2 GENE.GHVU01047692.1~~GHVU01047692.1.p2  ORF type:complete len:136 (+),score=18.13 GHVU01047692.1:633-1040(+)